MDRVCSGGGGLFERFHSTRLTLISGIGICVPIYRRTMERPQKILRRLHVHWSGVVVELDLRNVFRYSVCAEAEGVESDVHLALQIGNEARAFSEELHLHRTKHLIHVIMRDG